MRELDICGRSKRWWKPEFKEMRKKAVKDKKMRKELKRKIKESKAKCWQDWIEERRDVWQIARVSKNPFQLRKRCHALEKEEGSIIHEDDQEGKCRAFIEHNVIYGQCEATPDVRRTARITPPTRVMDRVRRALGRTKSSSSPGPDGVTWRLLKALKDTKLGKAVLEDIGQMAQAGNKYYGEEEWRQMEMIIIPKPGRDHSKVKGWYPIVLLNTVGKLADKLIAEDMGNIRELFHERAFAGRKGRGAIDSVMLMDELRRKTGGHVYGRDIKSAFNSLDRDEMYNILWNHEDLREWVDHFLRPRSFKVKVDGETIGSTTMVGGTPQGSPLSPTLFTIYMSRVVWEAEGEMDKLEGKRRRSSRKGTEKGTGEPRDFIPLSYIDDVNSVRKGRVTNMDKALEGASQKYRLKWDRSKDWKDEVHLGVNLNGRKHWKFRTGRVGAAFNGIRRLTRLNPEGKRKIVIGQLLPTLTYGSELHTQPSEEAARLAGRMSRWICMGTREATDRR